MSQETLDAVEARLESVLADTTDPETKYELRSAMQLLEVHRASVAEAAGDTVETAGAR